jgi:hypothetical protein
MFWSLGPSTSSSLPVLVMVMPPCPLTKRAVVPSPSSTVTEAPGETSQPATGMVIRSGVPAGLSGLLPVAGVPAGGPEPGCCAWARAVGLVISPQANRRVKPLANTRAATRSLSTIRCILTASQVTSPCLKVHSQ